MKAHELRNALGKVAGYAEAERRALPGKAVALAVAQLRADQSLTQKELADRIGTSQSVIARIESGRRAPNTQILNDIAVEFGMTWKPVFERPEQTYEIRSLHLAEPAATPDAVVFSDRGWQQYVPKIPAKFSLVIGGATHGVSALGAFVLDAMEEIEAGHEATSFVVVEKFGRQWPTPQSESLMRERRRPPQGLLAGRS